MSNGVFFLIIIGIGLCLAWYVDRLKSRPGGTQGEPPSRKDKAKWLYYWYLGRFPTREEEANDEEQARREREKDREEKPRS